MTFTFIKLIHSTLVDAYQRSERFHMGNPVHRLVSTHKPSFGHLSPPESQSHWRSHSGTKSQRTVMSRQRHLYRVFRWAHDGDRSYQG